MEGEHLDLPDGARKICWIDGLSYLEQLTGAVDWTDDDAAIAWLGKGARLISNDAVILPVSKIVDAFLEGNSGMLSSMGERQRVGYPLRILLSDDGLRQRLADLTRNLRASAGGRRIVVELPDAKRWAADMFYLCHGERPEVSIDEQDMAWMHVADFLRPIVLAQPDALLLRFTETPDAETSEMLMPIANMARHSRVEIGCIGADDAPQVEAMLDFAVNSNPGRSRDFHVVPFLITANADESGQSDAETNRYWLALPVGVEPEAALARISQIRGKSV